VITKRKVLGECLLESSSDPSLSHLSDMKRERMPQQTKLSGMEITMREKALNRTTTYPMKKKVKDQLMSFGSLILREANGNIQ